MQKCGWLLTGGYVMVLLAVFRKVFRAARRGGSHAEMLPGAASDCISLYLRMADVARMGRGLLHLNI